MRKFRREEIGDGGGGVAERLAGHRRLERGEFGDVLHQRVDALQARGENAHEDVVSPLLSAQTLRRRARHLHHGEDERPEADGAERGPERVGGAPPTAPEKSFVPAGAKYHWHIVPPMTYMRVSSAALVTQSSETIERVMYSGTHESTANPQQSVGSPAKSEHAFVAASRDVAEVAHRHSTVHRREHHRRHRGEDVQQRHEGKTDGGGDDVRVIA